MEKVIKSHVINLLNYVEISQNDEASTYQYKYYIYHCIKGNYKYYGISNKKELLSKFNEIKKELLKNDISFDVTFEKRYASNRIYLCKVNKVPVYKSYNKIIDRGYNFLNEHLGFYTKNEQYVDSYKNVSSSEELQSFKTMQELKNFVNDYKLNLIKDLT